MITMLCSGLKIYECYAFQSNKLDNSSALPASKHFTIGHTMPEICLTQGRSAGSGTFPNEQFVWIRLAGKPPETARKWDLSVTSYLKVLHL